MPLVPSSLRQVLRDLGSQKLRTFLTVFGIIWGTAAVSLLLTFGEGLELQMRKATAGIGSRIVIAWPSVTSQPFEGLGKGRRILLTEADIDLLRQRADNVGAISPEYEASLRLQNGRQVRSVPVSGVAPIFGRMRNLIPREGGRFINLRDSETRRRVVFLGDELAGHLFDDEDPVGCEVDDAVIRMSGVTKVYDTGNVNVEALHGIDFSVAEGEFVAIVGPSGSGKSTLMNLIGCLDTPTGGDYLLRGERVSGLGKDQLADIRNRKVGFVFQNFNLLPQITAYENVEMPLLFGGVPRRACKQRVTELLERVGLGERMHHKPTELSGGQMQRVAIPRALAMDPEIVLADEPTGNLDSSSGTDVMGLFEELWSNGTTMVIITHDPALARRAARTVEIRDGLVN